MSGGKHKYPLGSAVRVKGSKFPDEPLLIYQVSCGDGRSEPHYWARTASDVKKEKDYEFDETDVVEE